MNLGGNAAEGAEDVPEQDKQAFTGAVEAGGDDLVGVEAEASGEGEGSDAGDVGRGCGCEEGAEALDDGGVDAVADEGVEEAVELAASGQG